VTLPTYRSITLRYPFLDEYLSAADFKRPLELPSADGSGLIITLQIISFDKKESYRLLIVRDITQVYNLSQTRRNVLFFASFQVTSRRTEFACLLFPGGVRVVGWFVE